MKQIMGDLKQAILNVLNDATFDDLSDQKDPDYCVRKRLLDNLQAEFNIYFVEPDEEQVNLI